MSRIEPAVEVEAVPPPSRKFVGRLNAGITAATTPAALMAAEPSDDLSGSAAGADNDAEVADRGGVEIVVGPVVRLS